MIFKTTRKNFNLFNNMQINKIIFFFNIIDKTLTTFNTKDLTF